MLSGSAASDVVVNGAGRGVDPNNPYLYKYTFTGTFQLPTIADPTDPCEHRPDRLPARHVPRHRGRDERRRRRSSSRSTTRRPRPPTCGGGPGRAAREPVQRRDGQPAVAARRGRTSTSPSPASPRAARSTSGRSTATRSSSAAPGAANLELEQRRDRLPGRAYRRPSSCRGRHTATTSRRSRPSPTENALFVDGQIIVSFPAGDVVGSQRLEQHERTAAAPARSPSTRRREDSGTADAPFSVGPLSIAGPSISLVDTKFNKGKLTLTIGIGADAATLAFGGSNGAQTAGQQQNGISATLTGILVTFDVQVDVLKAVQALQNPSALLAAFSVPGKFGVKVASLNITVPNIVVVTATGINVKYDPTRDAAAQELVRLADREHHVPGRRAQRQHRHELDAQLRPDRPHRRLRPRPPRRHVPPGPERRAGDDRLRRHHPLQRHPARRRELLVHVGPNAIVQRRHLHRLGRRHVPARPPGLGVDHRQRRRDCRHRGGPRDARVRRTATSRPSSSTPTR